MLRKRQPKTDDNNGHLSRPPKRQKMGENDDKDRLSRLPNDVVRRILSLLPPSDAFASRRLCKTWFLAWASDPILDFAENDDASSSSSPSSSPPLQRRRFDNHGDLVGFADDTISKLTGAELVRTLRLSLRMYGRRALERIDAWLRFAKARSVRVLDIDAVTNDIPYTLPQSVLGASSLTVLNLANLELKVSGNVSLDSLEKLSLSHVKFDEESARRLISSCPSLERLDVSFCFGARTLRVSNPSLRTLEVKHCARGTRIAVEEASRSLETLAYAGRAWGDIVLLGALDSLTALRLHVMSLDGAGAAELEGRIARLPRLEALRLAWRGWGRRAGAAGRVIKIRGERLKYLVVDGLYESVDVVVDAPNLVYLEYDKLFVSVTSLNSPKLLRELKIYEITSYKC